MKFGQLTECNKVNTFYEKSCTHCVWEKLVPDPFLKNKNREYLWINSGKCYKDFLLYV